MKICKAVREVRLPTPGIPWSAPGLPATPIDLEFRQVDVGTLFRVLADVSKRDVILDPCVTGKVDLKLRRSVGGQAASSPAVKLGSRA
jgi:hypothetical protein